MFFSLSRAGFMASLLVLMAPMVSAQEATVRMRFLAFPAVPEPEPVELVVGEGQTIKVDTPGNEMTAPYTVPKLGTIMVGKSGVNDQGKPFFQTYGQAAAIAAKDQIVLLLRKGDTNSDGFIVLPINGELGTFGGAHFYFINTSSFKIGGRIGDKTLQMNPGQRTMLKPAPDFPGGICQVSLAYLRDNEWKMFFDTRWPANEKTRALVFFYQNPKTGRLGIAPITDIIGKPQEAEAAAAAP